MVPYHIWVAARWKLNVNEPELSEGAQLFCGEALD